MKKINKTKYILGGGFMKKAVDEGQKYYRAIVEGQPQETNILICCFALSHDKWDTAFVDEKDSIQFFNDKVLINFQNADPNRFVSQVLWANVIVFRGGSTKNLMELLSNMPNWHVNLAGKTIVGSSAGACMISSNYLVTDVTPQFAEGLGLLPIVIATHYRSTFIMKDDINVSCDFWDKVDDLAQLISNGKKVILLKEGSFDVMEV